MAKKTIIKLPLLQAIDMLNNNLDSFYKDLFARIVADCYIELKKHANSVYLTGRFESSISIADSPLNLKKTDDQVYPSEPETFDVVVKRVKVLNAGLEKNTSLYIGSNVPYVFKIEYGSENNPPRAFFRLTLDYLKTKYGLVLRG